MARGVKKAGRSPLFFCAGLLAVAVAVIGFSKTFFYPLLTGAFSAPPVVYLHGLLLYCWVGFFLLQSGLVQRGRLRLHRRMGWVGAGLVIGVVASTLAVAVLASRRTAASGALVQARSEMFVIMIEMAMFAGLVIAALLLRKRPEPHKRLMLLALIGSLGPAWFRFRHYFPAIENPIFFYSVLLADSLIVIAAIGDLLRRGAVHPVYVYVGGAMVATHLVEVFLFEAPLFRAIANVLAAPFI